MFRTTQWSQTFPAGSTASESSTASASDAALSGTPSIPRGGLTFDSVYPYSLGIGSPSPNAGLGSSMVPCRTSPATNEYGWLPRHRRLYTRRAVHKLFQAARHRYVHVDTTT
jgi:hypothetical protein